MKSQSCHTCPSPPHRTASAALLAVSLACAPALGIAAPGDILATATPPVSGESGRFGGSVAIQGNFLGIGETNFAPAGKAYSFQYRRRPPNLTPIINVESPGANNFGKSVAFRGRTLFVGAPDTGTSTPAGGRAAAISGAKRTLGTLLALYTVDGINDTAYLGFSLARIGPNILVGAPGADDTGIPNAGKAFLINGKRKTLVAELTSPAPLEGANFGFNVANAGSRLIVGAPTDGTTTGSGRVYVFRKRGPIYQIEQIIENPNPEENAFFGFHVMGRGQNVFIGAPGATVTSETQAGRAYIFRARPDRFGAPIKVADIPHPAPQTGANFGAAGVLPSARVVAVGAPGDSTTSETAAGAVYFFNTRDGTPFANLPKFQNPSPQTGAQLGAAVAGRGQRILIGEPGRENEDGAAHLISLR